VPRGVSLGPAAVPDRPCDGRRKAAVVVCAPPRRAALGCLRGGAHGGRICLAIG